MRSAASVKERCLVATFAFFDADVVVAIGKRVGGAGGGGDDSGGDAVPFRNANVPASTRSKRDAAPRFAMSVLSCALIVALGVFPSVFHAPDARTRFVISL